MTEAGAPLPPSVQDSGGNVLRPVVAALFAVLGPWLIGMSIAFLSPGNRWSVEGEGAVLLGMLYLAAFGATAAWIAGNYQIALGALAGEAFALGSLGRGGAWGGVILSIGAGAIGGWVARRVTTESLPPGTDPRAPEPGTPMLLVGIGAALAIPISLVSYGRLGAGIGAAAVLTLGVVSWIWRRGPGRQAALLTLATVMALLSVVGVAWGASAAARQARRIANREPPLAQVLELRRADGMSFGDFVRARYGRQLGCAVAEVQPNYLVLRQGPVHQRDGRLVLFYEILFTSGGPTCPHIGGFEVAVFAESVPPRLRGEILAPDCETHRRMGEVFLKGDECAGPISEVKAGQTGAARSVDWLTRFRAGDTP